MLRDGFGGTFSRAISPVNVSMRFLRFVPLAILGSHVMLAQARVFTGLTLIDGTGRDPIPNAAIVVRDGRIEAAGRLTDISIPVGAERVSLAGKWAIPGLMNAHGHVTSVANLRTYSMYGITTVFSLGDEPPAIFAARDSQRTPALTRSRVFVAGPVLAPKSTDEARTLVRANRDMHADIVKIRVDDNLGTTQKMSPEIYRAVIDEAHRLGARVAVHLFYLSDAKAVLAAGADEIAHSVRDSLVDPQFIAAIKQSGICLVPTLMREVSTFVYETTPDFFSDSLFLAYADMSAVNRLKEPARQQAMRDSPAAQRYKITLQIASQNLKRLSDAGVPIAMGTDTGPAGRFQGYFELMELELMVRAGLTPKQALASATRDAARCIHHDRELGTIETGKWSDFVVLDANPLENISNVRRISSVWIAGNQVAR